MYHLWGVCIEQLLLIPTAIPGIYHMCILVCIRNRISYVRISICVSHAGENWRCKIIPSSNIGLVLIEDNRTVRAKLMT